MIALWASTANGVHIETVPVGNPGNAGEQSGGFFGPARICGSVGYAYNIGKYEVTAGQYTEFLNTVAGVDTYGLYNLNMWSSPAACKIERYAGSGTTGDPYQYRVAADWANRPVTFVSWGDAARFANWLHNGQPTGAQDASTTEDGAYTLNGAMTDAELIGVNRETDWKWAITSEDEWYKAAYHNNDGVTGNYWLYPTSSDSVPSNELINPDPGNNANFWPAQGGYTIGSPYYRTEVGEFENSESPYGTFDQGGNVMEWNEAVIVTVDARRGAKGGAFGTGGLEAWYRSSGIWPSQENAGLGFRVAQVPPSILSLDILPSDCPNEFTVNFKSKGRLPMAILGTDSFNVADIRLESISICGVAFPVKSSSIDDVSSPAEGGDCSCSIGADSYDDLVLHFSRRDVIAALDLDMYDSGTVVPITVTGVLLDGTSFEATDCVTLKATGK